MHVLIKIEVKNQFLRQACGSSHAQKVSLPLVFNTSNHAKLGLLLTLFLTLVGRFGVEKEIVK